MTLRLSRAGWSFVEFEIGSPVTGHYDEREAVMPMAGLLSVPT
jgi:hypothetical protein